jgi:protein required for attachment to host cells
MPAPARKTWVVVANGTSARAFRNTGVGKGLQAVPGFEMSIGSPPTRELGADRPGRVHDRFGPARHAMEPKADWHRQDKTAFAVAIAGRLESAARGGDFDRLVLVAPPTMMGDLRAALDRHVHDLVTGEVTKDLVHASPAEIEEQLSGVLAV